jgi:hypothetical protein
LGFGKSRCAADGVFQEEPRKGRHVITTNDWLPIGSVVHISERKDSLVFILGMMQADQDTGQLWDYCGLPYPTGYDGNGGYILFNKDSIDCIYFVGYQNADGLQHQSILKLFEDDFEQSKAAQGQ